MRIYRPKNSTVLNFPIQLDNRYGSIIITLKKKQKWVETVGIDGDIHIKMGKIILNLTKPVLDCYFKLEDPSE